MTETLIRTDVLTAEEKAMLHAACLPWAKRRAAAIELGMTPTRMAQRTLQLLDDPRAARELPSLVRLLRQLRDRRRRVRSLS